MRGASQRMAVAGGRRPVGRGGLGLAAPAAPPADAAKPAAAGSPRAIAIVRDPLQFALFVLTILTISRVHQHFSIVAKLRPALLLVAASLAYAFLRPAALARGSVLRHWPARRIALIGALACASAVFGISLGRSATFILQEYSKTLVYAFLLIAAIRHATDLYSFVLAYVISSGILVFFAQFVFGLSQSANSQVSRLSNLYTYDANDLGLVLIVGLAMTLMLMATAKPLGRVLLTLNIVGIAAALARSGSRGAFLGVVAFGLGALALMRHVSVARRVGIVLLAAIALGIGAPPGYWAQMSTVLSPKKDYNFSSKDGRKQLILRGVGYMVEYPVFGLGINNFQRAECTISEKARKHTIGTGLRCTPPHNSYVQAGAELGVPGLLVWCSIVFGGIAAMLRVRRRLPAHWRFGDPEARFLYGAPTYFALALIGFAVTAFFLSFAWMDIIYFLAALMTGFYVSIEDRRRREGILTPVPMPRSRGALA